MGAVGVLVASGDDPSVATGLRIWATLLSVAPGPFLAALRTYGGLVTAPEYLPRARAARDALAGFACALSGTGGGGAAVVAEALGAVQRLLGACAQAQHCTRQCLTKCPSLCVYMCM
jgi:hypothetical protein